MIREMKYDAHDGCLDTKIEIDSHSPMRLLVNKGKKMNKLTFKWGNDPRYPGGQMNSGEGQRGD